MHMFDLTRTALFAAVLSIASAGLALAADAPTGPMHEATEEFVEKGRDTYIQRGCFCHEKPGRGDGNKEFREDEWGFPIRIRNVTHP